MNSKQYRLGRDINPTIFKKSLNGSGLNLPIKRGDRTQL